MALVYPQNGDLTKSLKSARKKVPQSARLRAEGGVQSLFGQCPNRGDAYFKGASLTLPTIPLVPRSSRRGILSCRQSEAACGILLDATPQHVPANSPFFHEHIHSISCSVVVGCHRCSMPRRKWTLEIILTSLNPLSANGPKNIPSNTGEATASNNL